MSFTGRLRLSLVLAAIFPTALISVIVVVGLSQQVKRIENRAAREACVRFTELLENTSARIEKNLQYIFDRREFQMMEWGLGQQQVPDPRYQLPLMSLDYVEYIDSDGRVVISADRPALVGQNIEIKDRSESSYSFVYENDRHGPHPSLALSIASENGYMRGGIFLDGIFEDLALAVTRSEFQFVDIRREGDAANNSPSVGIGIPYRQDDELYAVLSYDSLSEYYPLAQFQPYEGRSLFADFFTAVAVVTIFSLLLVIPAGLYFSARTRREFEILTGGAVRVASGDFSEAVRSTGEGEFSDLADSFNRMMRQLSEYREKLIVSQKIAAWQTIGRKIAHEVKNPLTPISIAIDDLKHSYREQPADYDKILDECSATIKGEVSRLKKLIDQFSTFAKMPPPEITEIPADEFVRDIAVLFKDEIARDRLHIENDLDQRRLYIDPDQVRQVFINLIKNGLEAGSRRIILNLNIVKDRFMAVVEDDGPGMPAKIVDEGPVPYYSTKEHGSGLGLIICQRIVFDHDGSMSIANKPEGGARVTITLPNKNAEITSR